MEELRDVGHDTPLVRAPGRADVLHVQKLLRVRGRKVTERDFGQALTSLYGTGAKRAEKERETHRNAEMLRRDRKGLGQILGCTRRRFGQGVIVEQVGSVTVNQSAATGGGGAVVRGARQQRKVWERRAER